MFCTYVHMYIYEYVQAQGTRWIISNMLDVFFTLPNTSILLSPLDRVVSVFSAVLSMAVWILPFTCVHIEFVLYIRFLRKLHECRSMLGPVFLVVTKAFQMMLSLTACPLPSSRLAESKVPYTISFKLSDFTMLWQRTFSSVFLAVFYSVILHSLT
jgi:hypothetical protein